jgi:hypothetical protein
MDEVPAHVQFWIRQLLDLNLPDTDGQVEVRLYANKGKVRKHPMVVLNGGSIEMVEA